MKTNEKKSQRNINRMPTSVHGVMGTFNENSLINTLSYAA